MTRPSTAVSGTYSRLAASVAADWPAGGWTYSAPDDQPHSPSDGVVGVVVFWLRSPYHARRRDREKP
ncbi:MAG: hypothetical protein AAGI54_00825 [Planctomycetota bacterium]